MHCNGVTHSKTTTFRGQTHSAPPTMAASAIQAAIDRLTEKPRTCYFANETLVGNSKMEPLDNLAQANNGTGPCPTTCLTCSKISRPGGGTRAPEPTVTSPIRQWQNTPPKSIVTAPYCYGSPPPWALPPLARPRSPQTRWPQSSYSPGLTPPPPPKENSLRGPPPLQTLGSQHLAAQNQLRPPRRPLG